MPSDTFDHEVMERACEHGSAARQWRVVAVAIVVAAAPAHAFINLPPLPKVPKIEIKVGDVSVTVSPIPGQSGVTVGSAPLSPTPQQVSVLVQAGAKELGKITGDVVREAGVGYANLERETKKGLTDAHTNLRKAGGDVERTVRQAGADASRELKATQREVEGAATATYRFTIRQAEGSVEAVRHAERRFREGKVIDAVWHLGLQPVQNTSDNAAKGASESAIVATAMSVAASTYGGPGGAAAYSAWLAYYQTGGDINAALRVGLTAAIQAYGSQLAAAPNPANAAFSESFKHAAVGGAMNGLAVAAAGGSVQDIQQTLLATAGSILVQDGYRSLSQNAAVAEFTKAAKQVYCLKGALERSEDSSCPSLKDYVMDAQGRIGMLDTAGVVQFVDRAKEIPGADWLLLSKEDALDKAADMAGIKVDELPIKEIDEKLQAAAAMANKVKGANIVGLLDDRWALSYEAGRVVSEVNAAVAPTVLLSYTGLSPERVAAAAADAGKVLDAALPKQPQEIVSCIKGDVVERIWVAEGKLPDDLRCVTGQQADDAERVGAAWFARVEGNFCRDRMLDMAKGLIAKGYSCSGR